MDDDPYEWSEEVAGQSRSEMLDKIHTEGGDRLVYKLRSLMEEFGDTFLETGQIGRAHV